MPARIACAVGGLFGTAGRRLACCCGDEAECAGRALLLAPPGALAARPAGTGTAFCHLKLQAPLCLAWAWAYSPSVWEVHSGAPCDGREPAQRARADRYALHACYNAILLFKIRCSDLPSVASEPLVNRALPPRSQPSRAAPTAARRAPLQAPCSRHPRHLQMHVARVRASWR